MKKDAKLDEKQRRILDDYFRRSVDGETMEQIAKSHGITRKTLWSWKETHEGKQLYNDFQKELSRDALPKYYAVLKEKALSGSYKHMELYAKIHNLLAPQKQEVVTKNHTIEEHSPILQNEMDEIKGMLNDMPSIRRVK
ncbi:phBC6A51 family helix-turn-helix protein [Priestia endophytica]|uniref:phBC6A51 family helix-turn-helix protein n=1 Tax=Priestia endophytica TaxID=135735 RepID=UPI00227F31A5|nr:phBC6A51 family helix-turn-helix protein [Priestia endophytica]MCY8233694.1 phBC6A51 family helix-turn-helix protein [Priestia endophytica]